MNIFVLINLFKPYNLHFEDVTALFDEKEDEHLFMEIMIDVECSKSADETCANINCNYNFINKHNTELYKQVINDGDA